MTHAQNVTPINAEVEAATEDLEWQKFDDLITDYRTNQARGRSSRSTEAQAVRACQKDSDLLWKIIAMPAPLPRQVHDRLGRGLLHDLTSRSDTTTPAGKLNFCIFASLPKCALGAHGAPNARADTGGPATPSRRIWKRRQGSSA
jgi:hypothetical protein